MTSSFLAPTALPYIAHLFDHSNVFKKTLQPLNRPALKFARNSSGFPITLELPAQDSSANAPAQGDLLALTEQGGDGSVVWKGIIEDLPEDFDVHVLHELLVQPLGVELADADFSNNYTAATDLAQMFRDIVARTQHLTTSGPSCPNTGITAIYDFKDHNGLTACEELRKMGGVYFYYFVDENGLAWFGQDNLAAAATYSIKKGVDYNARIYRSPIAQLRNYIKAEGAIPANASAPIQAIYDQTAGSPYGRRALIPPLVYPNLTDLTTLTNIVNTVGAFLNRRQTTVSITLPNFGQRITLANASGTTLRYWEPAKESLEETGVGSGAFSPNYAVLEVEVDGPKQIVKVSDMTAAIGDLSYLVDRMLQKVASAGIQNVYPITPGQVVGGTTGGPNTPSTPAGLASATGIDNVAQADNAYILLSWTANAANENVIAYRIRWHKVGDTNYSWDSAALSPFKIPGLIPGQNYAFAIAAQNSLGVSSALSSEITRVAATDSTAAAVPTGLAAIKTPRGALVSWNANSEADLQGYELQVSVGGGAYSLVTPGPQLATMLAYVAPSGTATGTALLFQVRSVDWSGNRSAWSSASSSVNSDGVVFDELLAGNLTVYGTLTSGGIRTAASGRRTVVDSGGVSGYDATATDYGAGAGVTFKNDTGSGSAFFKGDVRASGVRGTYFYAQSNDANVPTLPNPSATNGVSSMLLDPAHGIRGWLGNGTIADPLVDFNFLAGTLTIYKNASIYASTVATSSVVGNVGSANTGFSLSGSQLKFWRNTIGDTITTYDWDSSGNVWKKAFGLAWEQPFAWSMRNNAGLLATWGTDTRMAIYTHGFLAKATAAQVIAATTLTQLTMSDASSGGNFSGSSASNGGLASSAFTVGYMGYYLVTARVSVSTSIARMYLSLYDQTAGSETFRGDDSAGNGQTTSAQISQIVLLTSGHVYDFRVWCSAGATTEYSTDAPRQVGGGAVLVSYLGP